MATQTLTELGEAWVVHRMAAVGTYSAFQNLFVGWGSGTTTANKTQTALTTESADPGSAARVSAAATTSGTGSAALWQEVITCPSLSTQTVAEAGLFSTSGTAVMFVRGEFTGIPLVSGDSIVFTFTLNPAAV